MTPREALEEAVRLKGSQCALSAEIGCTQQNISLMLKAGRVGAEYVLAIEAATGVSRHDLRPDLYPQEMLRTHTDVLNTTGDRA